MDYLAVKTKGNANPKGKPRVYFTCHQDDYEKAFEKICNDIFKTHDCAIYYTKNMADEYADENWETDLDQMNLFVIPVTFRLLSTPNRTMNVDFSFAKANHIPVLPIMLETGIDEIYSKEENFGELQYLTPYDFDLTAISYEEKLKKYLESVLISDEMAERIRKAFDAYIFLSYRKIDRKFANELMRAVHSNELCQNIAIWYDEFLTPGESFKENIQKLLADSKLFALLVTPNLPKRQSNGKKNFVAKHEFPDAKKSGIKILPVEMESTDKAQLRTEFEDIPECYRFDDEEDRARFVEAVSHLAHQESERSPEHNYLLGLAYLEGIDVEVNYELALHLIVDAGNEGLIDAIKQLSRMYATGQAVPYDIARAAELKLISVEYCRENQNSIEEKKRLFDELAEMAMLCLSGKQDKTEPSPGKLLSYGYGVHYYQEAIQILREIISDTELNRESTLLMRTHISRLCCLLSGGNREIWTPVTKEESLEYFKIWLDYATMAAEQEENSLDDIVQLRMALSHFLQQMDYSDSRYKQYLQKTIDTSLEICRSPSAKCSDYYSLLRLLEQFAIPYGVEKKEYALVKQWIYDYYQSLRTVQSLGETKASSDSSDYCALYDSEIDIIGLKSMAVVHTMMNEGLESDKKYAKEIAEIMEDYRDDYSDWVRNLFLASLKQLLQN